MTVYSAGFLEENAGELVDLVFQTLPLYQNLATQRAVLKFLKQCLHNKAFLKTMAATIVRDGTQRGLCKQSAYVLLCWSSAVVRRLSLPGARKAVLKIAECQVDDFPSYYMKKVL